MMDIPKHSIHDLERMRREAYRTHDNPNTKHRKQLLCRSLIDGIDNAIMALKEVSKTDVRSA